MEAWVASILGDLLSFLLLYKYVALFVIGYVAALALPIPASTTLVAAGGFASQGYFDISYVLMTAFVANISGDATGYFLARRYGTRVFHSLGLGKVLTTNTYKKLENYMRQFPQTVIFVSRFLTEIGPATSILSGLSRVSARTFFTFAVLGEIAYVFLYGLTGYYLGSEWENNIGFLFKAAMVIVSIGVTLNVIQWALYKKRATLQSGV
jgi:membrane protein DedA with SNARE-associated domain